MRVLQSYEEAFNIGKKCLDSMVVSKRPALLGHGIKKLPEEIDGPWEMSEAALANTLKYIFYIGNFSYLLCVTNGMPVLYKLAKNQNPPRYENKILKSLKNKKIKSKNKTWRLMQCVVFEHKKGYSFATEWDRFLSQMSYNLPDGVFLLTLTDSVLLRKDNREPWQEVLGDKDLPSEYRFSSFIPMLSYSGRIGYWDIPIVDYDDLLYASGGATHPEFNIIWDSKKPIAVFRGSTTGCGYTADTNMRIKLSTMKSEFIDAGITQYVKRLRFDPKEGLGQLDRNKYSLVSSMPMSEQSNHKYIIHIDGNVAAYRLLTTMLTGSLILKVDGPYTLWIEHVLKPMKHYVPVKSDLSDLLDVIEWCKNHDAKCKKIAMKGYEFAKNALTKDYINASFAKVLWAVK